MAFAADGRVLPTGQPPGRCGGDARGLHGGTRPEFAPASGPWGPVPILVVPYLVGHAKVENRPRSQWPTLRPRSLPGDRATIPPGRGRRGPRRPPAARGGVV